jgi:hypothetical protein
MMIPVDEKKIKNEAISRKFKELKINTEEELGITGS